MSLPYRRIAARLAITLLVTACSQDTRTPTTAQTTAQLVAANMSSVADSLAAAGDSAHARPFRAAAAALTAIGHSVSVTLTDNGTSAPYEAVAQRYSVPAAQCPAPPTAPPAAGDTTRPPLPHVGCMLGRAPVLILWQGTRADEVIMISAPEGTTAVTTPPSGPPSGTPSTTEPTRASFSDRAVRGMWIGLDGSVTLGAASATAACAASPVLPTGVVATCGVGALGAALDINFGMRPRPGGGPALSADTTSRRRIVLASTSIPVALMTITDAGPTLKPGICGGPRGGGGPGGPPPGGGPPGGGPPSDGPGGGGPPCGGPGGGRPPSGPPGVGGGD